MIGFRLSFTAVVGCVLVVGPALFAGCGGKKEKRANVGTGAGAGPNELLRVTAKAIQRLHRPALNPEEGVGVRGSDIRVAFTGEETVADLEIAALMPERSGWNSEHLTLLVSGLLSQVAEAAVDSDLSGLVLEDFHSSAFVPSEVQQRVLPGGIKILTGSSFGPSGADLSRKLADLRERVEGGKRASVRFKTVAIDLEGQGEEFSTEVLVEVVSSDIDDRLAQIDAVWQCDWVGREAPRLAGLKVMSYRETHVPGALYEDATRGVFANAPSFRRQMMHGVGYWCERLTRVDDMHITGHQGIAVGDVNGDGLDDVYVCDGGGLPNRLYVQSEDGTVEDRSAAAGVDFLESSRSALIVDLDNDGDQDLVVATVALVLFLENDGSGVFSLQGGHPGSPGPYSMAAADYDNDGDLDLYVADYGAGRSSSGAQGFEAQSPIPYNDAENGGRNILLANHGKFRFSDVTESVGLDQNNTRWTFAASWEDYDQDGDADLYVVNDFGRNSLYRNDGGVFKDVAKEVGVEDMAGGMSASWGDADGDGRMDLYVGNMFSAAGNRVTYQRKFEDSRVGGDVVALQRMARGNSLFVQGAKGGFRDKSMSAGVTMGRWAWSSGFVDLNNDGREDLLVANGYLSNTRADDL